MIVKVGTNTERNPVSVSEDYTIRQCLEKGKVNYSNGQTSFNGNIVRGSELDNSIADMIAKYDVDVNDGIFITTCVKQDNAVAA